MFALGEKPEMMVPIVFPIEDYFVDSADLGIEDKTRCYIPIFV